jgi:superoxide dismutase, Fe-Mn family
MPELSRRSLAAGAGLLVGALALPSRAQPQLAAASAAKVRVQPLTFNPEKVKWLSPKSLAGHHEIYAGSVGRLNAITEQLVQLDFAKVPPGELAALKREQQEIYNSSILHEIYFECIGEAPTQPSGVFAQALSRDFTSLDRWKAEFAAMGKALTDGKGLVILAYTPRDKRLINHLAMDHATGPAGCVPLIALDMYEHAYQPDFGTDAGKYVDTFVQMMRWITAERLYREAIRV